MTNTDTDRLCRSMALRVHTGADPRRLGRALAHAVSGARLWVEDVQGGADSEVAALHRERELSRSADPHTGPGLRVVLLRYTDQVADLVVVAHRAVLADPYDLARAVLGEAASPAAAPDDTDAAEHGERLRAALNALDRTAPPEWGLGTAGDPATGEHAFTVPADGALAAELTLRAALGLVLARCTGRDEVVLGVDPEHALTLSTAGEPTVGQYLERVRRAVPAAGPAPAIGLFTTDAPEPLTGEGVKAETTVVRPFLAPPHHLSLHLADDGSTVLAGICHYRRSAFGAETVRWLTGMLATAHRSLVAADPDTPLAGLDLLDAPQRHALARLGGLQPPAQVPDERIERIEQTVSGWARRTPDAPAVTFGDRTLTYRQLDQEAARGAAGLRQLGVRPGDRVGVCLDRSLDLVVVLLAVLKAGAAYVPMDPAYPGERLAFTTEDAALRLVVTESEAFPRTDDVRLVPPAALTADGEPDEAAEAPADAPAYVIYTSGSTGRPKGVVVPHRNVAALLAATKDDFGLGTDDVWTLFHSSAFDFSVWEIWGCLLTGGRLVVVPYWASRDPAQFAALLAAERVTVLSQTPSAFAQLMQVDRDEQISGSVRLVVFGGEPLDTRPLRFWQDRHPEEECRLVNMFGITETTVHVTAQTVTRHEAITGSRSVGRPLPGWHVYVLDPEGRELPPGVTGEIYVGGRGVAGRYLNRPELTEQRFLPDPHAPGLMYRSGDRGRLLPDGRLEHLGRLDNQVKLRGFRIELDEIRSRLLDAPAVDAAAVVLREGTDGDTAGARLDGYVVFRADGALTGDLQDVRRHAARFLPDHMVPSTLTALSALPLTPNGKVDTARLPLPLADEDTAVPETAGDDLASRLRAVWEKLFGFRVGPDDDFFTLGGNSLLGVRLLAAMREQGLPTFPLPQLYLHRTVSALTAVLEGAGART
ncbi:amino acid adenylation domain-containing protein [Streptomyces sp. 2231.1]|uniref:non-ribosomal peptide synthetase n=1 Tax=Streptomyces sp. 2231.1 TaxID=1855347 RepID=UPI0008999DF2|nr:non-ribosomal peptide synthetase [Streptomyces sp. 2231.1]SEC05842.1 amino acid adenylation domain-containing protein [Streptomyces sp. 2231.1]